MTRPAAGPKFLKTVPIFPLATVLFPGMRLPLKIFEARYMDMAKACLKDDSPFGVCLIREGEEVGTPAVPVSVGCLARIVEWDMKNLGVLEVGAEGLERFRLASTHTTPSGLIVGDIAPFPDDVVSKVADFEWCSAIVRQVVKAVGPAHFAPPHRFDDPSWVGYRLAEVLPLANGAKQELLELTDASARLEILRGFLRERNLVA